MRRHLVREHSRRLLGGRATHVREHYRGSGARASGSDGEYRGETFLRGGRSTELTSRERAELRRRFPEAFAFPESEAYPVPTVAELVAVGASRPTVSGPRHALNALARSDQHGSEYEKETVRRLVSTRYPAVYAEWSRNRR